MARRSASAMRDALSDDPGGKNAAYPCTLTHIHATLDCNIADVTNRTVQLIIQSPPPSPDLDPSDTIGTVASWYGAPLIAMLPTVGLEGDGGAAFEDLACRV